MLKKIQCFTGKRTPHPVRWYSAVKYTTVVHKKKNRNRFKGLQCSSSVADETPEVTSRTGQSRVKDESRNKDQAHGRVYKCSVGQIINIRM